MKVNNVSHYLLYLKPLCRGTLVCHDIFEVYLHFVQDIVNDTKYNSK